MEETLALLNKVRRLQNDSPFPDNDAIHHFVIDVITDACSEWGSLPGRPLGQGLYDLIIELMWLESFIGDLPDSSQIPSASISEMVDIRTTLRRREKFLTRLPYIIPLWKDKVAQVLRGTLDYFPDSAFIDVDEEGNCDDDSVVFPKAHAFDLCEAVPELLELLMTSFFDQAVLDKALFEDIQDSFNKNVLIASGLDPQGSDSAKKLIFPTESKLKEPGDLVNTYLGNTAFRDFFYTQLPFAIPFPARFEHTHIVGGTGHGKTQLMQFLIYHDLVRSKEDKRSIVILDSQGDLIQTISHLKLFAEPEVAERFVLVDPNDIEHPVCLNMFDFKRDRLSSYSPLDQEKILNATIELYEYFFGALLGAELTQRQGLIFKYLAKLLIEIPDATIHTLRDVMEDGERFRPYMEKLSGSSRHFFATQFFERKFSETKKQILTRLWGVLSNSSLERMFSHTENKIDIFELLNQGKIILINTAKDLLGQEGTAIFGRFFIALIAQASIQRSVLKPHERRSSFVYIDEAQDYFDDNISNLLNQARKYRVGLIFAHQNLDQLSAGLRSSVLASTTIKFAGGLSAKDGSALASEYRTDSNFMLAQDKKKETTEFACYVKNYTKSALNVTVPLGFVEKQEQISEDEYQSLLDSNREAYSAPAVIPDETPFNVTKPTASLEPEKPPEVESERHIPVQILPILKEALTPTKEESKQRETPRKPQIPEEAKLAGRGGRQHKYIQQLVNQLAEERGFRATIEETILDGAGRVDVSLIRDDLRIACQVSVTTTKDWELGGVEKCLEAGYSTVLLIGGSKRHTKNLKKFVEENLDTTHSGKVVYLNPEEVVIYLDGLGLADSSEQVVRGYKVRSAVAHESSVDENRERRELISEVIAKSLRSQKI